MRSWGHALTIVIYKHNPHNHSKKEMCHRGDGKLFGVFLEQCSSWYLAPCLPGFPIFSTHESFSSELNYKEPGDHWRLYRVQYLFRGYRHNKTARGGSNVHVVSPWATPYYSVSKSGVAWGQGYYSLVPRFSEWGYIIPERLVYVLIQRNCHISQGAYLFI